MAVRCGDPWHGFTRVRCPRCRHEFFVAFSCGARTVCPSCAGRRMAAASVHLTDRVLPDAPVRQHVLSALDGCRTVALSRGRFERLDDQGRAQQRLFADDEQGMRRKKDARWSADWRGFSLHAGVSFGALDRRRHLKLASGDRFPGSTVRRRQRATVRAAGPGEAAVEG